MDSENLEEFLHQLHSSTQQFVNKVIEENQRRIAKLLKSSASQTSPVSSFRMFSKSSDDWSTYFFQLEQHFVANGVKTDEIKKACLLSWIDGELLELLQKLYDGKVKDQSYNDIIETLNDHFIKKQYILAARYKFFKTIMKSNQTYADWVADLREAAKECMFQCEKSGCSHSYVDNKIRDMLVIHTPHDEFRITALQQTNPSLEEVLQLACTYESRVNTSIESESEDSEEDLAVHLTTNSRDTNEKKNKKVYDDNKLRSCPSCEEFHNREDCFHYKNKTICFTCSKPGHIASVCMPESFESIELANVVEPSDREIFGTSVSGNNKIFVNITVNGVECCFQVDTGATCSLIGLLTFQQLGKPKCEPTRKKLRTYGGNILPLKGLSNVCVEWNNSSQKLPIYVVDSEHATNILGLDWFDKLNFEIKFSSFSPTNQYSSSNSRVPVL